MSDWLRTRPSSTPAMLAVWQDERTIAHALAFEAALARAEAAEGLIETADAEIIAEACNEMALDPRTLADEAAHAGTLAIPLVRQLREAVPEEVRRYVHLGSTSQDLADTAMMLQVREGCALIAGDSKRILDALMPLAREFAAVPAMGRTLLQDAMPIGLGLRIAQWHAGIADSLAAFEEAVSRKAVLQYGGAVGTRAGVGGRGGEIAHRIAEALGLPAAPPWHARRTGVASIATTLAILIGATAKMARDVSLLAQNSVAEMHEPKVAGRGGSSAMAHKRNPTGCQTALNAAARAPGLTTTILAGLPAEHERGISGWQSDGAVIAELFLLGAGAVSVMADIAEGLEIDGDRIAALISPDADIGESAALVEDLLSRGKD